MGHRDESSFRLAVKLIQSASEAARRIRTDSTSETKAGSGPTEQSPLSQNGRAVQLELALRLKRYWTELKFAAKVRFVTKADIIQNLQADDLEALSYKSGSGSVLLTQIAGRPASPHQGKYFLPSH